MPWCDTCSKYWTPAAMRSDGSCPTCGAVLPTGAATEERDAEDTPEDDDAAAAASVEDEGGDIEGAEIEPVDDEGVPWHFKLLIAMLVIYLVYRFVEIGIKIFT